MSELKKTAKKKRSAFMKWFRAWVKDVKKAGKTHEFYEPYPVKPMVLNALVGVAVGGVGGLILALTRSPVALPALITGFVVAILTAALSRHSIDGRRLYLGWKGFKKHLRSIERGLGPVTLDSRAWGCYMAAAIIFGMHKKLIPKLQMLDGQGHVIYPVWYHGVAGVGPGEGLTSMAEGLTAMVTTVSTTMSSASGVGGGASGGGGGGSGGGGGGAG